MKHYKALSDRYNDAGIFGQTLTASILYMITSGCTSTTQYGYAEMLNLASDGVIDFIEDTRVYEHRSRLMKDIFCRHGFHIVYDRDVTEKVGDGFFFSLGYGDMTGDELVRELIAYGISSISLSTTGSLQEGVRVCCSRVKEEMMEALENRVEEFEKDHAK